MKKKRPIWEGARLPPSDRNVTLDMALQEFLNLTNEAPAHFDRHVIRDENKQSGRLKKAREIFAPDARARYIHRVVRLVIRLSGVLLPSAVGSLPGSSPLKGLRAHRRFSSAIAGPQRFARYWYLTDLKGAYGSVPLDRMVQAFLDLIPSLVSRRSLVEEILKRHCFLQSDGNYRGLYTGGPVSQDLFNIYCERWLDPYLRELGYGYTRYIDDLTFSSINRFGRRRRSLIMKTIRDSGLNPNLLKTQGCDLKKGAIMLTGLVVHWDGRVGISKKYAGRLSWIVNCAEKAIAKIKIGELAILPRGLMGSYGILKNVTKGRPMTVTERDLMERYTKLREEIKSLRLKRKKKKKKPKKKN